MIRFHLVFAVATCVFALSSAVGKECKSTNRYYDCGTDCKSFFRGCFHAKGPNTILPQSSLVNLRDTIDWAKWAKDGTATDLIEKCGKLAVLKNKDFFGVEYYGECYFGESLGLAQSKVTTEDGCHKHCGYDVGGPDSIVVYQTLFHRPSNP